MRCKSLLLGAFAIALVLVPGKSVAGPSISSQTAPGVNFGTYRTYSWIDAQPPAGANPIIYQQIIADIESALAQKGFQKADPGDLSLIITVGTRDKTDIETWGRWGLRTDVWQYTEGQLSLDAFETNSKKAVWHGQATDTVNPKKPNQSKIDAAVRKLMDRFPAGTAAPATQPPQ